MFLTNYIYFLILTVTLVSFELFYFFIAKYYHIADLPNYRSSHSTPTIRGGGIIFLLAIAIHFLWAGRDYPIFVLGFFAISTVSFCDDIKSISNKIRILVHLAAMCLLFIEVELFQFQIWLIFTGLVLSIGTINAYNFMDGINGITGSYSLLVVSTLFYINRAEGSIIDDWFIVVILSLLIFLFFNFRRRARCFAGDVGSIGIAFIIVFFLLSIIIRTGDVKYVGLLMIYGLDTVSTIIFRIIRKENIFMPHRSHFYQYLANVRNVGHLQVSIMYVCVQLLFNVIFISNSFDIVDLVMIFSGSMAGFILMRFAVEGKVNLLKKSKAS